MSIVGAFMVPHPPMILPEIGKGEEATIQKTIDGYRAAMEEAAALEPETVIITSPHSVMYSDYFHISDGKGADGDFGYFRAPEVKIHADYDTVLVKMIAEVCGQENFPAGTLGETESELDHGTMIPLIFLNEAYKKLGKEPDYHVIRLGLSGYPLPDHYMLGMIIRYAVEKLDRRAVFIASGDLSHKLREEGPYGLVKEGPEYDERIMEVMSQGDFGKLLDFDQMFLEKAAECGHRSFTIMAGALDRVPVKAKFYSHETVTGVGYGICSFLPAGEDKTPDESRAFLEEYYEKQEQKVKDAAEKMDPVVKLAKQSVEYFVKNQQVIPKQEAVFPDEFLTKRAGVFVSLHENGQLRGCIGTISAARSDLAEEIIQNGVSACANDPRFDPVREEELRFLEYSVDVLGEAESVPDASYLDPQKYGVIVTKGGRRGLLLPDLEGVDTAAEQISIAKHKAGIEENEEVELERFAVVRYR